MNATTSVLREMLGERTYTGHPVPVSDHTLELLPLSHREVIEKLKVVVVADGAIRLLGGWSEPWLNIDRWNAEQEWRFAWGDRLSSFFFFGETAWGDQYAYKWLDVGRRLAPEVYYLDANTMEPTLAADDFDEFVAHWISLDARDPFDEMTAEALRTFGPLDAADHFVFVPSMELGGQDEISNVSKLPARTSQIFAGDIFTAVQAADPEDVVHAVEPYVDSEGRPRLEVKFRSELSK